MNSQEITIVNKLGLHARAAAKFVTTASQFISDIQISNNGCTANGKSIMSIMMLAASQGSTITVITDGADEEAAMETLNELIQNRFGEDE